MLSEDDKRRLLALARQTIAEGHKHGPPELAPNQHEQGILNQPRACFVTLHLNDHLRGCVGCLEPRASLLQEVATAAYNAAFCDPRFSPVPREQVAQLDIHISVLTPPVAMQFADEDDLLRQLRPMVDGLVLRDGEHSSTFLPDVWETLPEPRAFLRRLKRKAGLPPDYWSSTIRAERYQTIGFG